MSMPVSFVLISTVIVASSAALAFDEPDGARAGQGLYLSKSPLPWQDAYLACGQGSLASLETHTKDEDVKEFLARNSANIGDKTFWTAGRYDDKTKQFVWQINAEHTLPITFENWLKGSKPYGGSGYCVITSGSLFNYGWSLEPCISSRYYICNM